MIQLIANIIVFSALGGAFIIVVIVIVKTIIALAAAGSTTLLDPAVSVPHCRYCGQVFVGSEVKCEYCGAVRQ